MKDNKTSSLYRKKGDCHTTVFVLARGVDLNDITQIVFCEIGNGYNKPNTVLPEVLFEKNYEPFTTLNIPTETKE